MMDLIKTWWQRRNSSNGYAASDEPPVVVPKRRRNDPPATTLNKTSAHVRKGSNLTPTRQTESQAPSSKDSSRRIESRGPGKNVLIRSKQVREDTGTHEKLTILDEDSLDTGEESGIDPYNTGGFDRSKNWDNRFRK